VSYEPALGIIDWIKIASYVHRGIISYDQPNFPRGLDWVIMGCESGPNRRPMDIEWARSMRDQCQAANVPFFLKQMEIDGKVVKMPALDGVVYDQYPEEK
jgi:protein gp37